MTPEEKLAAFQSALMDLLAEGADADRLRQELSPFGKEYWDWLDALQPRTLDVGHELMQTWGRPTS
jgi:hypothetical protein